VRIVSIGGGSGLSTLLRGLKLRARAGVEPLDITAVVAVSDDGGSSGRLRRDFDVLPPGDIRNCMVALSNDEALLSRLFQYRFAGGRGLKGHSFGNLFLTAMTHLTGDFGEAVKLSSEVLAVSGRIFPATRSNVALEALLSNGTRVSGETRISRSQAPIVRVRLKPRRVKPLPESLDAIASADLITLGPGSLYTSLVPNLLVDGIPRSLAESPAPKVYFVNLMSQPGETTGLRASDHLAALLAHCGRWSRGLIDICVANTGSIPGIALDRYRAREARPVEVDRARLRRMGVKLMGADLSRIAPGSSLEGPPATIRHNPEALGAIVVDLAREARRLRHRLAS
jgi:uncharacterized cofD-like protein